MAKFHSLSINKIIKETANAVKITFEIPSSIKEIFQFIPGQYITLKKEIKGKEVRRSYSICSSTQDESISIAVKAIPDGLFSNYALTLSVGDTLEVSPPEGKFVLTSASNFKKNYMAIVAGSGITPVMSMIKKVLSHEPKSKFVLVYGNKSSEETIFKQELDDLSTSYQDRLQIQYVFSKKISDNAIFGRIDKGIVNKMLKTDHKSIKFDDFFLCGPEAMIDIASETIKENEYAVSNIHFELFNKVFPAGIEPNTSEQLEGQTKITVLLDDDEETITAKKKTMLLTAMLDEDLDPPYSCKGGVCSSCIAKVTKGKAVMDQNSILTDDEIKDGMILTCQAHAVTDEISLDFDNV